MNLTLQKPKLESGIISIFLILALVLIPISYLRDYKVQMYLYLAAIGLGLLIVQSLARKNQELVVKNPGNELFIILGSITLAFAVSYIRFFIFTDWNNTAPPIKIVMLAFMVFFVFPVAVFIYLLVKKYKLKELGLVFDRNVLISLIIIALWAFVTFVFFPEKQQFTAIYKEMGLVPMILTGFLTAALPEEFMRFLIQSRLIKINVKAEIAIFISTVIWTLLHFANFYAKADGDLVDTLVSLAVIAPLGLLWGYLTYKTNSIIPSVLIHGVNLWGLHHFGS